MKVKEIPVLLLTGYLGSGKTTLVNHILANKKGIRFAVIVNDIGEVNIDADLIQKGGIVGKKDESLVALQNGCICCTLRTDLIEQVFELMKMNRFDYIVIEASGICEPEPIAQTICSIPRLGGAYSKYGICRLDCIVTVVDALRMQSEFACGNDLTRKHIDEEDIENLIIQQIEFCNIILLNKASEVSPEELARIRQIIQTLQPAAEIIECDYASVDLNRIIDTRLFNFEHVATSAGWIREMREKVDLILSTGGVSVGEKDLMPEVFEALGIRKLFHGVQVKPGAPTMAGMYGNVPVIALSGNPFGAMVHLELLVRPVLEKMTGSSFYAPEYRKGVLVSDFARPCESPRIVRARWEDGRISFPEQHASGVLASLGECNCLAEIKGRKEGVRKGETIWVRMLANNL